MDKQATGYINLDQLLNQGIQEQYTDSTMYYSVYVGDFVTSNMYRKRITLASYD